METHGYIGRSVWTENEIGRVRPSNKLLYAARQEWEGISWGVTDVLIQIPTVVESSCTPLSLIEIFGKRRKECDIYYICKANYGSRSHLEYVPAHRMIVVCFWAEPFASTPMFDVEYVHSNGGKIPKNAFTTVDDRTFYLGRTYKNECPVYGRINPSLNVLIVYTGDKFIHYTDYEILVKKPKVVKVARQNSNLAIIISLVIVVGFLLYGLKFSQKLLARNFTV